MSMTTRSTPRGQVIVGDLSPDFLRVQMNSQQQQCVSDEQTAQFLQAQQSAGFSYVPGNVAGRLSITIAQARLAKNYGITKMDPYCRLRVGHAVFETPTSHNGSKNPRWNKVVQCYLPVGVDSVYLEIFDEKTFQVDDRIAWAHIGLPQSVFTGETHEDWYPLTGKQGDDKEGVVNLIFSYTAVEAPPQAPMPMYMPTVVPQMMPQVVMMPSSQMPMYYTSAGGMVPGMQVYSQQQLPAAMMSQAPMQQPMMQQPMMQQPVMQQRPLFTDDDVNQIKDVFPSVDKQVIKSVLEANGGNKDATINALLQMGD